MSLTVAEALVDLMVEAGITHVYGIVGDSANPIVDAMRKHEEDIEFVYVCNEEAGAFAAGAAAQVSGRPTAVLGSSGPGSLHLLNGLYDCKRNGASVFAIATNIPSTEVGTDYFQETAPEQIFAHCTRYRATITTPAQTPLIAELALQADIQERGVGMVIVSGDVAAAEIKHPALKHAVVTERPLVRPSDAALDRTVELVGKARRIAIFGGAGTSDARDEVLQLSDRLKAPVVYAYRGKGVLEHDNPAAVGITGLLGWGGAHRALGECDLIMIGSWPSSSS